MSRDPSAWLGKIEPEKPRNARLWDGTAGEAAITPPNKIRSTPAPDRPVPNPTEEHSPEREAAPKKVKAARTIATAPVVAPETPMPKAKENPEDVPKKIVNVIGAGSPPTPKQPLNTYGEHPPVDLSTDLDAALTEFSEASIDLDKALDRHTKARAAVIAAAGR